MGCDIICTDNNTSITISTHTSRVGCDCSPPSTSVLVLYFYSHIPCGMWRESNRRPWPVKKFLLTHPVWDVTQLGWRNDTYRRKFLLTHPVWDVTWSSIMPNWIRIFLLTHPVWDVTQWSLHTSSVYVYFYSHIPCGMWPALLYLVPYLNHFYSHIPCGMWRTWYGRIFYVKIFLLTHPVWDVTYSLWKIFGSF